MKLSLFILSAFILCACGVKDDYTKKDSPTSGKVTLYFEEGITPHIQNQIFTFKSIYPHADISLRPSNENEAVQALYNDCTKVIAITRQLTQKELDQFKAKNVVIDFSPVAGDAVALIVNKNFPDSIISINTLTELLKGNDTVYQHQAISILFDNANSGSTKFLKDSLLPNFNFGSNCSAKNNTPELFQAIRNSTNTIGVCDYAWLSDYDDVNTKEVLKDIKILAVSKNQADVAYMPDQSNIATKDYPLTKTIYIIRRSAEFSLGKGIETFIAGEKGQLMFLKQGLPPNRQEERVIEIDMTPIHNH